MPSPLDLKGQVIGSLTVERYRNNGVWECRCACGQTVRLKTRRLRVGKVQSCGCQGPAKDQRIPPETFRVVEWMDEHDIAGSTEMALDLELPSLTVCGVLRYLYNLDVVEKHRSSTSRNSLNWGLKVSAEEARMMIASVEQAPLVNRSVTPHEPRDPSLKPTPMITEEDLEWMAHYRQRWVSRYQRQGLPIPIRFD